ncbi:RWD domain [Trinorchestia longiramus]|nr:RWD domain [Trinorchestia longiramus]
MSEDNITQQCDEIEAVAAIYGDDFRVIDEYFRQYGISVSAGSYTISLVVKLPVNYPSESPPHYELDAQWLRGASRRRLQDCLDETYL